jgi:endonuclease/exonuclease/phosphatase (EEP) superfamily protein YafD
MKALLPLLALLGLGLLGAGFLGRWWPPGDSLAVGRLWVMGGLVLIAPLAWRVGLRRLSVAVLLTLLMAAVPTGLAWRGAMGPGREAGTGAGAGAGAGLILYQKNVNYRGGDRAALIADLRASGADVVALQETVAADQAMFAALEDLYPTQVHCRSSVVGDVAILARAPAVAGSAACSRHDNWATLRLELPGIGAVQVVSLHLAWPWPFSQALQLPGVVGALTGMEGPVIVAGDFNMQPWGASVAAVAATIGGQRLGGHGTTRVGWLPPPPVIIDHVLVPGGWGGTVTLRPLTGSDHRGLLARITPP